MGSNDYKTSTERVIAALLMVAVVDAILSMFISFGPFLLKGELDILASIPPRALLRFGLSSLYWLGAVSLLWLVAHKLGHKQWFVLAIIGMLVPIGLGLMLSLGKIPAIWTILSIVRGGAMGLLLWRIAYVQVGAQYPEAQALTGRYEASAWRVTLAFILGGCIGVGVAVVAFGGLTGSGLRAEEWLFGFGIWLAGSVVLVGAPWLIFHKLGHREWYILTSIGAVAMLVVHFVVLQAFLGEFGFIALSILGSLVGWAMWRAAYRKT